MRSLAGPGFRGFLIARGLRALGVDPAAGRPSAPAIGGALVGLVLAGAFLFGLVHIAGGTWRGNAAAVAFGIGLSAVTLTLLAGLVRLARRRSIGPDRDRSRSGR